MAKLAIVATIKTAPGKRDEYMKHLKAHQQRCLDSEPGTLAFEILTPHDDADSILLYELYESTEAFDLHWNGPSIQQVRKDAVGLFLSLTATRCALIE